MASQKAELAVPVIFISSTAEDLGAYRKAAEQGARTARCLPDVNELWVARDKPPLEECLARVRAADAVVVIVAYRYGWVPENQPAGGHKSITWLECEEAARLGKEVLAFVVDDAAPWPDEGKEEYRLMEAARSGMALEIAPNVQQNIQLLRSFKNWLGGRGIRVTFISPEDLRGKIALALHEWKQRHPELTLGAADGAAIPTDPTPYLEALRDETGYIEIRGIRAGEGKAHRFSIDDLYVPLMNELRASESVGLEQRGSGMRHDEGKLDLDKALSQPRLVIVGDPGAGKSTFLKRIVHALCESRLGFALEKTRDELKLNPAIFPILIRISDLADFLGKPAEPKSSYSDPTDSPMWIVHFLDSQYGPLWGLDSDFFRRQFQEGPCFLGLDGLDEAPRTNIRERLSRIVERASLVWPKCRMVITTRPPAYTDETVLAGFSESRIGNLDKEGVRTFLRKWSDALFPENGERAARHARDLANAVESRADIQRITRTPVMLTALAVLHWNEKRLPQQRADLYESILTWLSRSRKQRPNRPTPERCITLLQELARAMQEHPAGRQVQVAREWAAGILAPRFREINSLEEQRRRADDFLAEEELDSGIVVRRGSDIRFWHLTFQEHLAARALAGEDDRERRKVLFADQRAWQPEWREVTLLLAGILHQQKVERVDALVSAALDTLTEVNMKRLRTWFVGGPSLAEQARCVSLLGAMMLDLEPLKYQPADPRFDATLRSVMGIFDSRRSAGVPLKTRVEAAEALGRAGDPRLRENKWVTIRGGTFVMGEGEEAHEVELSDYEIEKYPVTVEEFGRYVAEGGPKPGRWEQQLVFPNRPVVNVSWHDAVAYCGWAGVRLPTEAEWERAARGEEGRRYAWGDAEPDSTRANYADTKIGAPTPVGLFPQGATPDGIQDLAGNVWEWVVDWFGEYPRAKQQNPTGPQTGEVRVLRGGAWNYASRYLRAAYRGRYEPEFRVVNFGIRCARELSFP